MSQCSRWNYTVKNRTAKWRLQYATFCVSSSVMSGISWKISNVFLFKIYKMSACRNRRLQLIGQPCCSLQHLKCCKLRKICDVLHISLFQFQRRLSTSHYVASNGEMIIERLSSCIWLVTNRVWFWETVLRNWDWGTSCYSCGFSWSFFLSFFSFSHKVVGSSSH